MIVPEVEERMMVSFKPLKMKTVVVRPFAGRACVSSCLLGDVMRFRWSCARTASYVPTSVFLKSSPAQFPLLLVFGVCVCGGEGGCALACLLSNAKDSRNMPLFFNARILRQRKITDMMKLDLRLAFIGRGSAVRSHSHSLGVYAPACGGASRTPRPSPQCDVKDLF